MRFHYVRADDVRKTIGYDESLGKTATDPTIPSSFFVSPATLDMTSLESCRAFVNSTRVLGSPCFELYSQGRQCVSRKLKETGSYPNSVTRTKADFAFLPGPGLMFVDCDMKDPASHYRALVELGVPPDALRLEYFSSSSFLHRGEQWVTQASGRHIMLAVENAADIPQMGEWLYLRSWLAGNGYVHITPNGRALDRSYVDQAVWQPERLVFGRPTLKDGLAQVLYEPEVSGARLLKAEDLYLTDEWVHEARRMIAEAKREKMNDPAVQASFVAFALANRHPGETIEDAIRLNSQLGRLGQLPPYLVLNTKYGHKTVQEIFSDFERYFNTSTNDPVEPHYGNGDPRIAYFVHLRGQYPGLYSHAHGGQVWVLMPATVGEFHADGIYEDPFLSIDELMRMQ